MPAHALSSVPPTVKCSWLSNRFTFGSFSNADKNACAMASFSTRSRFFVKLVTSRTASSIPSPTN